MTQRSFEHNLNTFITTAKLFLLIIFLGALASLAHPLTTFAATLTIYGTLYSDEGTTQITTGKTIKLAIGTSTVSVQATTTDSGTGTFSFSFDNTNLNVDDPFIMWVDNATEKAVTISKFASTTADLTGIDLYQNRIIIRQEGSTSTTISDLATYDYNDDTDLQYKASSTANTLEILNAQELHIWSGDTFVNAASSTFSGSFHNDGGVFDDNNGTSTFTGTNKTLSGTLTGASELGNVVIEGSYTASDNASVSGLTIKSGGSFAAPALLTITGDYQNSGTFDNNSGTVYIAGSQDQTLSGAMTGTSGFNHLEFTGIAKKVIANNASATDFLISTESAANVANWDPNDVNVMDGASSVAVQGSYAYVTGALSNNLVILDISSSTNPIIISNWTPNDVNIINYPTGVAISGSYVYVAGEASDNLVILNKEAQVLNPQGDLTVTTKFNNNSTINAGTSTIYLNGDYRNDGVFKAGTSEVVVGGASRQLLSGNLSSSSAFYDLTLTNVSGSGSSTQSVVFGAPVETTNTFTMLASTSAQLPASATSTFQNVSWQGAVDSPVWLRSSQTGSQWYLSVPGTRLNVDYVNVSDSNASGTNKIYAFNSTDSGNSSHWDFDPTIGSSTIANHDAGQVNDAFDFKNKTNEALFAFKLTPNTYTATVTEMVITLSGAQKIDVGNFSNIRLYRDLDNDAAYDAADVQVGGVGVMALSGQHGTITFSDDFLATTSQNYVVVADWNTPENGSFLTLNLYPAGVSMVDATSSETVYGAVDGVQHSRNNRGGGEGAAAVGEAAPTGRSVETGGTNDGGELIGDDPNYFWPTAHTGAWNNGQYAYDKIDGTYATTATNGATTTYQNYGYSVPGGNTINGIEVKLEISAVGAGGGTINVELSWDGGTSWTIAQATPALTNTDTVVTLGGPSDLWGRTWSPGEFSNANFKVRVTGNTTGGVVQIDAIQVQVYHQASGGGGAI